LWLLSLKVSRPAEAQLFFSPAEISPPVRLPVPLRVHA
jgi:hypothetical protein